VGRAPAEVGKVNSLLQILNSIEKEGEILRQILKERKANVKYIHIKWKAYSDAISSFLSPEVELTLEKRNNFRPASHILSSRTSVSGPLYQIK
jgi:hypothetical protein